MRLFLLPLLQKYQPVQIKTAATAAFTLISLAEAIIYKPAVDSSVVYKGFSLLAFVTTKTHSHLFLLRDADWV